MHGVKRSWIEQQAQRLDIPLEVVSLPEHVTNQVYEEKIAEKLLALKAKGWEIIAYGDLFLSDLKAYRERQLAALGMQTIFPLWQKDTLELAKNFVTAGYKAYIVCVDEKKFLPSAAGQLIDMEFIDDLPYHVDPSGENGEFHSFVFDGPCFPHKIPVQPGEKVQKLYPPDDHPFTFCELVENP